MTTTKLSFTVENAEMINENPNSSFAVLSMDFFASGQNLHEMWVSEETLHRTADTIKNCPIVWKYDPLLDDVYTHDKDEVPCGFVPETSEIKSRVLEDGRTMLSVVAYVWKKYTGEILSFFKRDSGKKPVSVEMSVFDMETLPNGLTELRDYKYEAITVLGSFVTPAVPGANANVLSFEYKQAYDKEFLLRVPEKVKENSKRGLELKRKYNKGGSSVDMSFARTLANDEIISPAKAQNINRYFSQHKKGAQGNTNPPSSESINWLLWGGDEGKEWISGVILKMSEEENRVETNDKEIINMADTIEKVDEVVEPEKVEMAEPKVDEVVEPEKVEMAEPKEEGEEKKFEFPPNFSMEQMCKMFAEDEDDAVKMAKAEAEKGEFADPGVMMSGMFARMCKMSEIIEKMSEDSKVYMAENEELKKFKAEFEAQQKLFAIEQTLTELSEKVIITDDAKKEMVTEAEKYSFAQIEEWKTYCKAKSFDFAIRDGGKSDVVRVGMPFTASTPKNSNDLWS